MSNYNLNFAALEECLQTLEHLFIDKSRLVVETGYEERCGGYGNIQVSTLDPGTPNSKLVAAKRISLRGHKDPQRLAFRLARELRVWAGLHHPHILPLLGYYLGEGYKVAILMSEYMIYGDLRDYLNQTKPSWAPRLNLARDLTDGLTYLHGQEPPVCHGHLKPGNILVNAEQRAVLADFGLSMVLEAQPIGLATNQGPEGTLRYYSPELVQDTYTQQSLPSDIWAWACLVLEVLTDKVPYAEKILEHHVIVALVTNEPPSDAETLPIPAPAIKRLLANCWSIQPHERPSAKDCLHILNSETSYAELNDVTDSSELQCITTHLPSQPDFQSPTGTQQEAQSFTVGNCGLDFTALGKCLQKRNHLFIERSRLVAETKYKEKRGGYGNVHVSRLDPGTPNSKLVAEKRLSLRAQQKDSQRLAFRLARELEVWAGLHHPHVLPLLGYYLGDKDKVAILISEYMVEGDLRDYIERTSPSPVMRLNLIRDLTDGLAYLHRQEPPICHGDLKTGNVLVNPKRRAVLADFGLSRALAEVPTGLTTSESFKGTLRYCSPELVQDTNTQQSLPSDIWAWACLVLEVLTDKVPYAEKMLECHVFVALVTNEPPSDAETLPIPAPAIKRLLANCWSIQPHERPLAKDCLHILNSETSYTEPNDVTDSKLQSIITSRSSQPGFQSPSRARQAGAQSSLTPRYANGSPLNYARPSSSSRSSPTMDTTPPPTTPSNNLPPVSFAGGVTDDRNWDVSGLDVATEVDYPAPSSSTQSRPDARNGLYADHPKSVPQPQQAGNPGSAQTLIKPAIRDPVDKLIITVTADAENHVIVDITGAKDAAFIRERIFSKLRIPDDDHKNYQIYRTELGEAALGDSVTDDQLMIYCEAWGDAKGTLKFLIQRDSAAPPTQPQFALPSQAPTTPHVQIPLPKAVATPSSPIDPSSATIGVQLYDNPSPIFATATSLALSAMSSTEFTDDGSEDTLKPGDRERLLSMAGSNIDADEEEMGTMKSRTAQVSFSQAATPAVITAKGTRTTLRNAQAKSTQRGVRSQSNAGEDAQPNGVEGEEEYCDDRPSSEEDERLWNVSSAPPATAIPPAIKASGPDDERNSTFGSSNRTRGPNPTLTIKWVKGELIGKGTYSKVFLAFNVTTGGMMAVKQVEMPQIINGQDDVRQVNIVKALESEQQTLEKLDHPNIVQYLGFEQTKELYSVFLEYVPGGSIGSCLRRHGKFEEYVIKSFTGQIIDGLAYLHANKIIHRDIKADNVLIDPSGRCVISDFSKQNEEISNNAAMPLMQGSLFWMAPEMLHNGKKGYNAKIDIWSLGCVFIEMFTGRRPWEQEDFVSVIFMVGHNKMAPPVPSDVHLSEEADGFRLKCFAQDPDERPTAEGLRDHPWLDLPHGWIFSGFP